MPRRPELQRFTGGAAKVRPVSCKGASGELQWRPSCNGAPPGELQRRIWGAAKAHPRSSISAPLELQSYTGGAASGIAGAATGGRLSCISASPEMH